MKVSACLFPVWTTCRDTTLIHSQEMNNKKGKAVLLFHPDAGCRTHVFSL